MKIFAVYFTDYECSTTHLFYNHNDLKVDECRRIVSEALVKFYKEGHAKHLKELEQHAKRKAAEVFGWMIDGAKKDGVPLQMTLGSKAFVKLWKLLKAQGLEKIDTEEHLVVKEWDHLRFLEDTNTWTLMSRDGGRATKEVFRWWWRKLTK